MHSAAAPPETLPVSQLHTTSKSSANVLNRSRIPWIRYYIVHNYTMEFMIHPLMLLDVQRYCNHRHKHSPYLLSPQLLQFKWKIILKLRYKLCHAHLKSIKTSHLEPSNISKLARCLILSFEHLVQKYSQVQIARDNHFNKMFII